MKDFRLLLLLCALIVFIGCEKEELSSKDYVKYVTNPQNGLNRTKSVRGVKMSLQYKPDPLLVLQENRGKLDRNTYEKGLESYTELQYLNMKLALENAGNIMGYGITDEAALQERIRYFSFEMQDDISMVQGQDTLPCALYHFERSYDLAPSRTFVVAFEDRPWNKEDRIVIWNSAVFGTGLIKIAFKNEDIQNTPKLKL